MANPDIRWHQRLVNFARALGQLQHGVNLTNNRPLSPLETQGLIQAFEFTHELAWNVMKDYFEYQGASTVTGSRDATREAFRRGLVTDGESWMAMLKSRNETSHTYNEQTALEISGQIIERYAALLTNLRDKMESLRAAAQEDLFSQ